MKDRHVLDELSAYLDGEAKNPERIARHLDQCDLCARRRAELEKISAQVKSLAAPEADPAFITRVMASIAEPADAPQRTWLLWAVPLAAAAVLLLVVTFLAFMAQAPTGTGSAMSNEPGNARETAPASRYTQESVFARIERSVAAGQEDALEDLALSFDPLGGEPDLSAQDALDLLGQEVWFDGLADTVDSEQDLTDLLAGLNQYETQTLKELLNEYATEEWTI